VPDLTFFWISSPNGSRRLAPNGGQGIASAGFAFIARCARPAGGRGTDHIQLMPAEAVAEAALAAVLDLLRAKGVEA
jgi:hypothetical protein